MNVEAQPKVPQLPQAKRPMTPGIRNPRDARDSRDARRNGPGTPTSPADRRAGTANQRPSALPSQQLASQAPKVEKGAQKESCVLRSARQEGSTDIIEIGLEGGGEIHQTLLGDQKESKDADNKMEIVAGFRYEERIVDYRKRPDAPYLRSIRQYDQAGMKRNYQGSVTKPLLLDVSRKNLMTVYDGSQITHYSPAGPLKSDQLLLISEIPVNTLLLDYFLPDREVKLGEEWTVPDDVLKAFLGLETMESNTVRLALTAIIDDMAEVTLFLRQDQKDEKGEPLPSSIQGASLGASVMMDLKGLYQFDLKTRRMTWFSLNVAEQRSESLAEPGIDWKGTIRIKIAPLEKPEELTDERMKNLLVDPDEENLSLVYNGQKGPWNFRHSRRWRMVEDGEKSAALALIEKGEGIAQCNILSNGKIELSSMPSLQSYKEELKKGLGDQFGAFVSDSEFTNDRGDSVLAVMIDGQADDVPFRRIYYLFTDPKGYQATVMFDILADQLEKFGEAGQEITDSFTILTPPEEPAAEEVKSSARTETPKEDGDKEPEGAEGATDKPTTETEGEGTTDSNQEKETIDSTPESSAPVPSDSKTEDSVAPGL